MEDSKHNINRALGGRIVACSDQGFADAENLVAGRQPEFRFGVFVEGKGQEFDSWETRRHNPEPPDWVVIELSEPGPIQAVDIDTHWHDGNHAQKGAVYALQGSIGEDPARQDPRWVQLVPPSELHGHAHNLFTVRAVATRTEAQGDTNVSDEARASDFDVGSSGGSQTSPGAQRHKKWTHVMLENHPDGGIARLRCWDQAPSDIGAAALQPGSPGVVRRRHPAQIPRAEDSENPLPSAEQVEKNWAALDVDPTATPVDLACESLGGQVVATSNNRYGHSQQLLADAEPMNMGDGWETSRARGADASDHVVIALGQPGVLDAIEVDFSWFILNNPVAASLSGAFVEGDTPQPGDWQDLVPRTRVKELAGDVWRIDGDELRARGPFTHVRLETFPCGGANRLRIHGRVASRG